MYDCSIAGVRTLVKQSLGLSGVQELEFISNLERCPHSDSVLVMMSGRSRASTTKRSHQSDIMYVSHRGEAKTAKTAYTHTSTLPEKEPYLSGRFS